MGCSQEGSTTFVTARSRPRGKHLPARIFHDTANSVAKEFVVSRHRRRAGTHLLINPYDVDQVAQAIYRALGPSEKQQEERMARMRKTDLEHNVYGWAASLLSDLTEIRVEVLEHSKVAHAS
jgi:trehalose-6-phosphate synthase